jgi:hypothetical protein
VAKVQFAAYWSRFDISYTAAQLARFCASAGPSHWAALTHLIGYLIHRPSLKIRTGERQTAAWMGSLTLIGATLPQQRVTQIDHWTAGPIQSDPDSLEIKDAEGSVSVLGGGGVLLGIGDGHGDDISPGNMRLPAVDNTSVLEDKTASGIEWSNRIMAGRERAKHMDMRKHFVHGALQNGHIRFIKIPTEFQRRGEASTFASSRAVVCLYVREPCCLCRELSVPSAWGGPRRVAWTTALGLTRGRDHPGTRMDLESES